MRAQQKPSDLWAAARTLQCPFCEQKERHRHPWQAPAGTLAGQAGQWRLDDQRAGAQGGML